MRTVSRDIVGAFIFSNDRHLLIGKNAKGGVYDNVWVAPGGGIEAGESMLEALKREMLEEVGIDISTADISPINLHLSGEAEKTLRDTGEKVWVKMKFNNFKVVIDKPAKEIPIKLEDDLGEARWCKISELSSFTFSPSVQEILEFLGHLNSPA
jgi:8-oxo-dGTP diphosphatase